MHFRPKYAGRYLLRAFVLLGVLSLPLQLGCRKRAKKSAPKLEITTETSEVEERNLRALCAAAAEVRKQPGVQDRLARIAEIAAPTSATTELLDGLIALEGPKRLSTLKQLVAKYGIGPECRDGLPAFEVAAEAPAPNAPTPPATPGAPATGAVNVAANPEGATSEGSVGIVGSPTELAASSGTVGAFAEPRLYSLLARDRRALLPSRWIGRQQRKLHLVDFVGWQYQSSLRCRLA